MQKNASSQGEKGGVKLRKIPKDLKVSVGETRRNLSRRFGQGREKRPFRTRRKKKAVPLSAAKGKAEKSALLEGGKKTQGSLRTQEKTGGGKRSRGEREIEEGIH